MLERAGRPQDPVWCRPALLLAMWIGLTAVMLQPTPRSLTRTLPNDLGDPSFVIGIMRWGAHALVHSPLDVFDAPFFWPADRTLGFSETFLSVAPVHGILTWLTGSPVTAFNLLTILLFVLSLVATYHLGHWLLGRTDAAITMAAVFTFTSYSLGQQSHLQVLTFGLLPLGILGLFRFLDTGRRRDVTLVVVASAALVYASIYYSLLWSLVGPGLVVFLLATGHRPAPRTWRRGAAAAVIVGLVVLPGLALHADVSAGSGLVRPYEQVDALLWGDLLTPAAGNWLWGSTFDSINSAGVPGDHGFMVGILAYVLGAIGLVVLLRQRGSSPTPGPTEASVEEGTTTVVAPEGVLDRGRALWALLAAGLGSLLVGLGPEGFGRASPYRVLYKVVPGFDGVRSSSRLAIVALLALAALVGLAVGRIAGGVERRGSSPRRVAAVVAVLLAVMMAEVLVTGRTRADAWDAPEVRAVYEELESRPGGAVLELPIESPARGFAWPFVEAPRLALYAADADHPRVNGYSGHWPPGWLDRTDVLRRYPDPEAAELVEAMGIRYLVVHTASPWESSPVDPMRVEEILDHVPEGATVERHGTAWLVDLRPEPRQPR